MFKFILFIDMKKSLLTPYIFLFSILLSFTSFAQKPNSQNCSESQPAINGEQHPCPGDIETYCVASNTRNYTSYAWDVPRAQAGEPPVGWEILSYNADSSCVTVRVGQKSGTMKVKVTDPVCGTKVATLPVKPGKGFDVAVTGPDTVCTDEEQTYRATVSKRNGNSNANTSGDYLYVWSVPADWIIVSGEGTATLTVIPGVENGEVSVYLETEESRTGNGNNGKGVGGIKGICDGGSASMPVYIGEECGLITPLPVELLSFEGEATKAGVLLSWVTASEKDNDRFEVERSADGKMFALIGSVKGKGTTQAKQTYSMRDTKAAAGTQYYRLKQVDLDGTFEYSKVIAVENGQMTAASKMVVAPNPVSGGQFTVALNSAEAAQLQIMDMNGRMVYNQNVAQGTREVNLNAQNLNLRSGMYIINLKSNTATSNAKFIVR